MAEAPKMNEEEEFEFRRRFEMDQAQSPSFRMPSSGKGRKQSDFLQNILPGAVRGAASIGNTLMLPADALQGMVEGRSPLAVNREYRQQADEALRDLGANPDSPGYKTGKLGAEVAGTLGVGPALAAGAVRAGVPAAAPIVNAIRSGGMTAGPAAPIGARVIGGGVTGAGSAGLVDPGQAQAGGLIGAALPVATKVAGGLGNAVGKTIRGPQQAPELAQAVQAAREAGYVIPPTQANPSLINRALEGFSGKITTAQNASARNQAVTNELAAKALGIPGQQITPETIQAVRNAANDAYTQLGSAGQIAVDDAFRKAAQQAGSRNGAFAKDFPELVRKDSDALVESMLGKDSFDAQSAIEAIKRLREGQKSGLNPVRTADEKAFARVQGKVANALEELVERNLEKSGQTALLDSFKEARKTLAKAYDVEKALSGSSVDAKKLAALAKKGSPLSGELKQIADFAARFPKASQTVENMGSLPQTSPLDWAAGAGLSAATANPLGFAGVVARPGARALTLSDLVQNRLVQQPSRIGNLLGNQQAQQLMYRAAPVAADQ